MRLHLAAWLLVLSGFCGPGAVTAEAAGTASGDFVDRITNHIGAKSVPCRADVASSCQSVLGRCVAYSGLFTRLKTDWDTGMTRHDIAVLVESFGPWTFEPQSSTYRREFEIGGTSLTVRHRPGLGMIEFCPTGADDESSSPEADGEDTASPGSTSTESNAVRRSARPEHMAGFGGVTQPRLRKESRVEPRLPEGVVAPGTAVRVALEAVILADGTVADATVLRCEPDDAAIRAAVVSAFRSWRFEPSLLAGKPVAVTFPVYLDFSAP